jgi:hypothetical protein
VRLSRNINHFLSSTAVSGGVLPAMVSTAFAILNCKLYFQEYLRILLQEKEGESEKQTTEQVTQAQVYSRVADLVDFRLDRDMNEELIPNKIRVILETAQKIGEMDHVPVHLKYWF